MQRSLHFRNNLNSVRWPKWWRQSMVSGTKRKPVDKCFRENISFHGCINLSIIQFSSVAQSCPTLCDPMDCSMPGFPVHHQIPELAQTYVHQIGDAIQPPHPLSSPSPPAFNLSQHQSLFQWVSSLHWVVKVLRVSASASVLPMNIQGWFPLGWTGWISLQFKGLSGVFSNTTAQEHLFFSAQLSLWSNSHIHTWPLEEP